MKTLVLNHKDIENLITVSDAVSAVKEAYIAFNSGQVYQPPITSIDVPKYHGEVDFKSGYSSMHEIIGIKIAGGFYENQKNFGLPSGMGTILLFDARNGVPVCILDGMLITHYRTAAAGALASTVLARKDSKVIGVIGTGGQARMQVIAHSHYFDIQQVKVWGIEGVEAYINEMEAICSGIEFVPCASAEEAVRGSDIIITATSSRQALVMNEWVKDGAHINAIGCDMEGKQELDPKLFLRAKAVNDNRIECAVRGDTQHPIKQGLIKPEDIHAEIGEILLGKKEGRVNDSEVTIFDATGMSIQDITTSLLVYKKALNAGFENSITLVPDPVESK